MHTEAEVAEVRRLVLEHAAARATTPGIEYMRRDADGLPGAYVPPRGGLWLAVARDVGIGCVALRPLDEGSAEVKRMYVDAGWRGRGVGRALLEALVAGTRTRGYTLLRLGTLDDMTAAQHLYDSLGFIPVPRYRPDEMIDTRFYELDLRTVAWRTIRRALSLLALLLIPVTGAIAQSDGKDSVKAPPPIADNSFLVEEAYNQESGVVQHISAFQRAKDKSWLYTFTQEWPSPSQRHQLSYTLPIVKPDVSAGAGIGDVAVNYRLQALGKDDEPLWISPRVSVLLPTGNVQLGRGAGGFGVELFLPVSYALSEQLVTHWNAGGNVIRGESTGGIRGTLKSVRAGWSAIWLATSTLNFMLETVGGRTELLDDTGKRQAEKFMRVSPGMRGAFNFASGLQIVPGVAIPFGVGPSSGERDLFLYLSFEHSFR